MKTSIIFNYFNPKQSAALQRTAAFALESVRTTAGADCEIICADGSGLPSDALAWQATGAGITYAPSEHAESFAETYNRGARLATGEYLVLCASDIIFTAPWLEALVRPLASGRVAMTCPYLSYSDYIAQCYAVSSQRNVFEPCCMTINVNAVRRDVWEQVGPLDLSYTGNYNDIEYLIRLRKQGLRAAVVDCGLVTHLGSATLNTWSQLKPGQDRATFAAKHPEFATEDFWHQCWHPLLCRSRALRVLLRAALKTAPRSRRPLRVTSLLRWEPWFNRLS